jgi:hypothetical protein
MGGAAVARDGRKFGENKKALHGAAGIARVPALSAKGIIF